VSDQWQQSLAENPTLAELAASVGLSPYHFVRSFKASVSLPPHSYQIQLRMNRARELLETTALPVTGIAAQVGYDDPSNLARLFHKHFGVTPAAYRREWQNRCGPIRSTNKPLPHLAEGKWSFSRKRTKKGFCLCCRRPFQINPRQHR
jgi:AraC-like DNA-binding protein